MAHFNSISDDQVESAAKALGWKTTDPAKARNLLELNHKSAKVQAAVQAEIEKAKQVEECLDALAGVDMPNSLQQDHGVSFGMSEQAAAKYIQDRFGLVPRMAKRAVNRGIDRDEYHGKGYVVKVTDTSDTEFDIQVFAA